MTNRYFLALTLALIGTGAMMAKPAKPGIRTVKQPDGKEIQIKKVGDEHLHLTTTPDGDLLYIDENGLYHPGALDADGAVVRDDISTISAGQPNRIRNIKDIDFAALRSRKSAQKKAPQSGLGLMSNACPSTGSPRGLIILVEYTDVKFNTSYNAKEYFEDMINGDNFTQYGGTGSAFQYFKDQSHGKFTPQFDVYGPITLPQNQAYYGKNDRWGDDQNAHMMVKHAVDILDPQVDFSLYDTNDDKLIDNIYIIYAGQGEADFGDSNTVWPHAWDMRQAGIRQAVDGVYLGRYACSNEWMETSPDGMGTFVHEFSHVMGLPDLYNTEDGNADYTPGYYSVLDLGNYNNDSRTPCNYGAYELNALGWEEPIVLGEAQSLILPEISTGKFCLIPTSKDTEFFLLENRQLTGWDKYLENHGMLIWHIDFVQSTFDSNSVNTTKNRQQVDIVEANNKPGINFEKGYPFPGTTGKTSFTSQTNPALKSWANEAIDIPITNIREKDGYIYFDVCGGGEEQLASVISPESSTGEMPVYFNLQGVKINNPENGMILIEYKGGKSRKIIY